MLKMFTKDLFRRIYLSILQFLQLFRSYWNVHNNNYSQRALRFSFICFTFPIFSSESKYILQLLYLLAIRFIEPPVPGPQLSAPGPHVILT